MIRNVDMDDMYGIMGVFIKDTLKTILSKFEFI